MDDQWMVLLMQSRVEAILSSAVQLLNLDAIAMAFPQQEDDCG